MKPQKIFDIQFLYEKSENFLKKLNFGNQPKYEKKVFGIKLKYEKSRVKLTRANILFESNCSVMACQLNLQH